MLGVLRHRRTNGAPQVCHEAHEVVPGIPRRGGSTPATPVPACLPAVTVLPLQWSCRLWREAQHAQHTQHGNQEVAGSLRSTGRQAVPAAAARSACMLAVTRCRHPAVSQADMLMRHQPSAAPPPPPTQRTCTPSPGELCRGVGVCAAEGGTCGGQHLVQVHPLPQAQHTRAIRICRSTQCQQQCRQQTQQQG